MHKNYTGAAQATCSKLFYVDAAGQAPSISKITVTGLEPTVTGKPEAIFKKPNAANPFATVDSYKIIHADIPATVGDQRWNK